MQDRVAGKALAALTVGRTWAGHFVVGGNTPFILQIDAENRVAFRTARSLEAGVVRVEDDRICMQYDGYLSNFWLCGAVYRTAAISRGAGADYVYVRPDDLLYFSVQD